MPRLTSLSSRSSNLTGCEMVPRSICCSTPSKKTCTRTLGGYLDICMRFEVVRLVRLRGHYRIYVKSNVWDFPELEIWRTWWCLLWRSRCLYLLMQSELPSSHYDARSKFSSRLITDLVCEWDDWYQQWTSNLQQSFMPGDWSRYFPLNAPSPSCDWQTCQSSTPSLTLGTFSKLSGG